MYGLTGKEAFDRIQAGDMDSVFTDVLDKYKKLESKCDFILIEGRRNGFC